MLSKTSFIGAMMRRSFGTSQVMRETIKNHEPNNLERRMLVWTGKYKTQAEVPNFVSQDVMERCRNKMRIRLANIMIALTAVGCAIMVYSGKQAAKRGESVTKMNLEWHKQFKDPQQSEGSVPAAK
ncbi:UPF0389 protein CG9231 [Drosophila yakuba]|uniref:Uncharacterized protein n=1 Tax=Drosophila yakuba TaxID=7245 RepID=B4IUC1_DROYA|nr:UPF0389 protein CG9231 [Drosophila yakuba]XP_039488747.1 UPF0389 protein CG9231 [Drosophila santomea]EDW95311.1 uncharacterized protein Dyak_GE22486 [Drosophila yakuba]EDW99984.1 uncharacterized protein Dyak_GE22772 [Drosophila yakuba]